jgi:hypothetical protein
LHPNEQEVLRVEAEMLQRNAIMAAENRGDTSKICWTLYMCKWVMQKMMGEKEELVSNKVDVVLQAQAGVFL